LGGAVLIAPGHVADDTDHRHAVEQGLADAAQRVGQPGPGDDAEHARPAGAPGVAVGHGRRGELVGHQQVGQVLRLQGVPQLVLLGAGDAEDALGPFEQEGLDEGLGAGHPPVDPPRRPGAGGVRRGAGQAGNAGTGGDRLEPVAPRDGKAHGCSSLPRVLVYRLYPLSESDVCSLIGGSCGRWPIGPAAVGWSGWRTRAAVRAAMKILVLNAGSSTLKFSVLTADTEQVLVEGTADWATTPARLTVRRPGLPDAQAELALQHHADAIGR